ncbi:MAG: hypothetical protein COA69_12420 [Robiginitomaculum sp.]|nr:MAG: hypothetical protein COA69_12420 [Robiginitomaculum sp.]
MRILFCGVAAIALSGCSWMGSGNSYKAASGSNYAAGASTSACCVGGERLSRWNFEQSIGAEFVVGGDAITASQVHPGFPAPAVEGIDVKMKDVYATGYRASLGGSYAINPNRKLTLQGFYAQADGNEVTWGEQGDVELRGTMSDFKSYGVEAGLRQYFQPKGFPLLKSVRPYIEARLGAEHVDAISMNNINQAVITSPLTPTTLAMYESTWVPTGSALIGIETPLFNRMTIGLETGIRYSGHLKSDNSDVSTGGFSDRYAGFNNGGDRYTVPLTLRGRYRF